MGGHDFGWALAGLRSGLRVTRAGWNGNLPVPRMWLMLVEAEQWSVSVTPADALRFLPWIGLRTVDGGFVPWLASQTDLLATDWIPAT